MIQRKQMKDIEIIQQLLDGNHLESADVDRASYVLKTLTQEVTRRQGL